MNKISKQTKIDNLNFLLDIAKTEYNNFFIRSQSLDAKTGIIITIIGAICGFSLDIEYIKNIYDNLTIYNFYELNLYVALVVIFLFIVIYTSKIILSKTTKFMPINIFNDDLYKRYGNIQLKKVILINSYKDLLEYNDKILNDKNKYFNTICHLSVAEIIIVIILQIFKII